MINILFVDDEQIYQAGFLRLMARRKDVYIRCSGDGEDALSILNSYAADIVITDVTMPKMNGIDLLKLIKIRHPRTFVVVITGFGTVGQAVEAMTLGACDYLMKPFDPDGVRRLMDRLIAHRNLLAESLAPESGKRRIYRFENIIGQDKAMYSVFDNIERVAETSASVLITGESGTGKERVAEAIHYKSLRKDRSFVKVNCAALTETLINSELFGYEKGAFTGANATRKGHFEMADKGTIFLDEIGDVPLKTQVSLLRVLDLRCFQRVGGTKTLTVDTRLICATHQDLGVAITEKRFREDLFFRINVVTIHLPPLRERTSDIPLLADYFLQSSAVKLGKQVSDLSDEARSLLLSYPWPGNVRELANVMERAVIFSKNGIIGPEDLPESMRKEKEERPFCLQLDSPLLAAAEMRLITKVLEDRKYNLKQAADALGIARGTLYGKMEKYGIRKPD